MSSLALTKRLQSIPYYLLLPLLALPIHLKITSSFKSYENFLSFIWTGDHLDEYERTAEDSLDASASKLSELSDKLAEVEADMEVCKLDTIDGMEPTYPSTLVKILGGVSILLDKVAATVDGVETKDKDRRTRRKALSKSIVAEFDRCDNLKQLLT
ncbi:hypothetical protein TrVE_jg3406 [Triparma verrucosa]|uniref:Uncharacterized protein n=1 Tax=Triparma verrucosa TaxID=1606542 RepID=A0A9W7CC49_9STRA|nr:hypothetical protein TrVE_jg3406 [Triparma verrucosa]